MALRTLLFAALCTLLCSGTARADLKSFMTTVNASYTGDLANFQDRLASRFAIADSRLEMVILSVDSPADAVICLWVAEQTRIPVGKVLQSYQQLKSRGWKAIVRGLGLQPQSDTIQALDRGDLDWDRQVIAFR